MARGKAGDGPNKAQLVRDAIAALGPKAKPLDIQKEIKDKAGVDISTQMISSYKSNEKKVKKGGKGRGPGRPAKSTAPAGTGNKLDIADDLIALRVLVKRLGATQLHKLIDVFG